MMKILPMIFVVFMLWFPAGLVLYWTVNNLFSMTHQHLVNKRVERQMKSKASLMQSSKIPQILNLWDFLWLD